MTIVVAMLSEQVMTRPARWLRVGILVGCIGQRIAALPHCRIAQTARLRGLVDLSRRAATGARTGNSNALFFSPRPPAMLLNTH